MEKLTSVDLIDEIKVAGIKYVPATKMYYRHYPYRITFESKHSDLTYKNRKRFATSIDLNDPVAARLKLAEKHDECIKLIENREHVIAIYEDCERLFITKDWKKKGGANGDYTLYLKNPEDVALIVSKYASLITDVTGPLNKKHQLETESGDKIVRDSLYYKKFRYQLVLNISEDFKNTGAAEIWEVLNGMDPESYRPHKIFQIDSGDWTQPRSVAKHRRLGIDPRSVGRYSTSGYNPDLRATLYLTDADDFFLMKLQFAEYVTDSNQVVMPHEIN